MSAQMLSAVPLTSLSGVGAKVAEKLAKVGLHSVQDLLFPSSSSLRRSHSHLPYRQTACWALGGGTRQSHGCRYHFRQTQNADGKNQRR